MPRKLQKSAVRRVAEHFLLGLGFAGIGWSWEDPGEMVSCVVF